MENAKKKQPKRRNGQRDREKTRTITTNAKQKSDKIIPSVANKPINGFDTIDE